MIIWVIFSQHLKKCYLILNSATAVSAAGPIAFQGLPGRDGRDGRDGQGKKDYSTGPFQVLLKSAYAQK